METKNGYSESKNFEVRQAHPRTKVFKDPPGQWEEIEVCPILDET